jgi:photosystem II stability/assembly factor-like uncharacterized protein
MPRASYRARRLAATVSAAALAIGSGLIASSVASGKASVEPHPGRAVAGRSVARTAGPVWDAAASLSDVAAAGDHFVAVGAATATRGVVLLAATARGPWVPPSRPLPAGVGVLREVACPDARRCVATGVWASSGLAVALTSKDAGATWSLAHLPGPVEPVISLSCAAPAGCVAFSSPASGQLLEALYSRDSGARWSAGRLPELSRSAEADLRYAPLPLSCAATKRCVALAALGGSARTLLSTDGGASWAFVGAPLEGTFPEVLACSGSGRCLAVAAAGGYGPGQPAAVLTSDHGGDSWKLHPETTELGGTLLQALACPSARHCVAVGNQQPGLLGAELAVSNDGGATWRFLEFPPNTFGLGGVACTDARSCVAVGEMFAAPLAAFTDDGGSSWWAAMSPTPTPLPSAIACTAEGSCLAVGEIAPPSTQNFVLASVDAGRNWVALPYRRFPGALSGVSCTSATDCVAVGSPANPSGPFVARTTDGGSHWRLAWLPAAPLVGVDVNGVAGISCAGETCAVLSAAGADQQMVWTSFDGGRSWHAEVIDEPSNYQVVACGAPGQCLAVLGRNAGGTEVLSLRRAKAGGRWTWIGRLPVAMVPRSLTCKARTCVLVGVSPSAPTGTGTADALASDDFGRTWQVAHLPSGIADLVTVACTGRLCVAGGASEASDEILSSDDGGIRWRVAVRLRVGPQDEPQAASCAGTSSCTLITGEMQGPWCELPVTWDHLTAGSASGMGPPPLPVMGPPEGPPPPA